MNTRKASSLALVLLVGLLLVNAVWAQTGGSASTGLSAGYDLAWWTVAGGGGTVSGGGYTMAGSVGQPAVGAALTGGGYGLTGGFWAGSGAATPTPTATTIHTPTPTATEWATATPTATHPATIGVYMPLMLTD